MGKLEKPLTWILILGLLGYLFMGNCCKSNSEYNEEIELEKIELQIIATDSDTNIDSVLTIAIEEIKDDSTIKVMLERGDFDTTITESTTNEDRNKIEKKIIKIKTTTRSTEEYSE